MKTFQTYIVTGATGGIGRAIVQLLAANNRSCHIIVGVRSTERGEDVAQQYRSDKVAITVKRLDLASFDSVVKFAEAVTADKSIRINVLFNNAGTMPGGVNITVDGIEIATQTNFVATSLLTELLLPAMADNAAIVFTTSVTRYLPRLRRDWKDVAIRRHQRFITYGRSKLMLTHYALDLSRRLADRGIRVNCSDPGVADTSILRLGLPIIDRLADMIVRPIVHTAIQGATAALRASASTDSGLIFTLNRCRKIPPRWADDPRHHMLMDDMQLYFRRYKKLY